MGITAMSCVRSTENADCPPLVRINGFSMGICSMVAVDDSDISKPSVRALPDHAKANQGRRNGPRAQHRLRATKAIRRWRISQSARGSGPIEHIIRTMPDSAKCCRSAVFCTGRSKHRPHQNTRRTVTRHRAEPKADRQGHNPNGCPKTDAGRLSRQAFDTVSQGDGDFGGVFARLSRTQPLGIASAISRPPF